MCTDTPVALAVALPRMLAKIESGWRRQVEVVTGLSTVPEFTGETRLAGGGKRIRTIGPIAKRTAAERAPAAIAISRQDLSLIRDPAGRSGISLWQYPANSFA